MSQKQPKRETFDLVAYVNKERKKIGTAYKTDKGSICLKADDLIDAAKLGRLMKKGLYIQKQFKGKGFKPKTKPQEPEYQSFADEYDKQFNTAA
jgi:hypothetical protein